MPKNKFMVKTTKFEKIVSSVTLITLFFILIPAVISIWAHFIPDNSFIQSIEYFSYITAILLFSSLTYFSYIKAKISLRSLLPGWKIILLPFLPFLMIWVFAFMFQDGVPLVFHQIDSEPGKRSYTITSKDRIYQRAYKNRGCSGGVFIEHPALSNYKVCGLSKKDWELADKGDTIVIFGNISNYGIDYDHYSLIKPKSLINQFTIN